jgi:hypothetical protein
MVTSCASCFLGDGGRRPFRQRYRERHGRIGSAPGTWVGSDVGVDDVEQPVGGATEPGGLNAQMRRERVVGGAPDEVEPVAGIAVLTKEPAVGSGFGAVGVSVNRTRWAWVAVTERTTLPAPWGSSSQPSRLRSLGVVVTSRMRGLERRR